MRMNGHKYILLLTTLDSHFDKLRPLPDSSPYLLFYITSLLFRSVKMTSAKVLASY